jgi:c-di-AMP phosphodiesterase-like protein
MYSGMMIDTNNFLTKTGVRTFEAAAFLRRAGGDTGEVKKLFQDAADCAMQNKQELMRFL